MARLCVNIDHLATLRQARRGREPDPVLAVGIVEMAGSTGITVHLREDRRHIQERDVELIRRVVQGRLNLELAAVPEMVQLAIGFKPDLVTLVPERREEITTEGGLDVVGQFKRIHETIERFREAGIPVSLFIEPDPAQIDTARHCAAAEVELHTGAYATARDAETRARELERLYQAAERVRSLGLRLNAGHGLNYHNVQPVAAIEGMDELNIGHAIISRAVFVGLGPAVSAMADLIDRATRSPQAYRPAGWVEASRSVAGGR